MRMKRKTRARRGRSLSLTALLAGAILTLAAGCGGGKDLDILLITMDTTRADHLACYGYPAVATPHLDALARQGILFANGIAPAPLTLPSHSSMMTGLTPIAHGVRVNATERLGDGAVTLAEALHQRGYDTSASVGAFVLQSTFGLAQGFDHYDEDFSGGKAESDFQFVERTADQVTASAVRWLSERKSKKPFFMWVHYFDAHMDYNPPSPFAERYASEPYDGEIAFVDRQIGQLEEALKDRDLWENTLVWVVGDHGESLGEHGEKSHSLLIYDATLHVPYIVSHPASRRPDPPPRWKPRRIDEQVELIDIYPTLLELTGAPPANRVEGQSLLPLLDGGRWKEQPAYSETMSPLVLYGWAPLRSVRTRDWKYIRAPEPELYDLREDPHELDNVAAEHPEETQRMAKELEKLVARGEADRIQVGHAELTDAERQKLASLGYLQTEGETPEFKELDPKELELKDPKKYADAVSRFLLGGIEELSHDHLEEAESLFRRFLEVDPGSGEGRLYLGLTLRTQGKLQESLDVLQDAAERSPQSFKTALNVGITYGMLNNAKESRRWLEKARELNPYSAEPWFYLGSIDQSQGDLETALARYEKALAIDDGRSGYHLARGDVLLRLGREEEGMAELRRAVEIAPRTPKKLLVIASNLGEAGHAELALPLFEELVKMEPANPLYVVNLGNAHLAVGDNAKAVEDYRTAVSLDPGNADYQYLLGCAYAALPDLALARTCFEKALELNPGHAEARHNLELLRQGSAVRSAPKFGGASPGGA